MIRPSGVRSEGRSYAGRKLSEAARTFRKELGVDSLLLTVPEPAELTAKLLQHQKCRWEIALQSGADKLSAKEKDRLLLAIDWCDFLMGWDTFGDRSKEMFERLAHRIADADTESIFAAKQLQSKIQTALDVLAIVGFDDYAVEDLGRKWYILSTIPGDSSDPPIAV